MEKWCHPLFSSILSFSYLKLEWLILSLQSPEKMFIHSFFIHKPLEEEQESEESPDGEEEGDESDLVSSWTFSNITEYQNRESFRCNALRQICFPDLNLGSWVNTLFQFVDCKLLLFSSEFRVQFEKEMEKESQGRPRLAPTIKETQEETESENRRTFWYRKCLNACFPEISAVGQHLSC